MSKCGKKEFASPKKAKRMNKYNNATVRVYWCDGCHAYHVTREQKRYRS